MNKSEERSMQVLISSHDEEKRKRLSAEQRLADALQKVSQLTDTVSALTGQVAESNASIMQLTQMLIGNGPVSLSEQVRNAITAGLREEFERREAEMKSAYERRISDILVEMSAIRNENYRLKHGGNDDGNVPEPPVPTSPQPSMTQAEYDELPSGRSSVSRQ